MLNRVRGLLITLCWGAQIVIGGLVFLALAMSDLDDPQRMGVTGIFFLTGGAILGLLEYVKKKLGCTSDWLDA